MRFIVGASLAGLAWAVVGAPSLADTAGHADGFYLRGEAGLTLPLDMDGNGDAGTSFTDYPHHGPIGGGALGLRLAPIRIEVDVDVMRSSPNKASYANDGGLGAAQGLGSLSGTTVPLTGTIQNVPVMTNLLYDFDTGTALEPYIGIGIGVDALTLHNVSTAGVGLFDTSQLVFAYQPMIGVNYAITDQMDVGLQYRYFATTKIVLRDAAGNDFAVRSASHNVLASLTYYFNAPTKPVTPTPPNPTPVVMPPASAASGPIPAPREFLVFFDFDKSNLTASGRRVVDEAIAAYQRDQTSAIVIRGYTDAVGSATYNLELSHKRAMAVYDYMAQKGVAVPDMGVDWQGKSDLRVPTQKREPQNRRVEIEM
jgi:outer membrane protein OmpA-like peptidoglycan-associated protein